MYEEALEAYVEQITERMTDLEDSSVTKEMEEKRKVRKKISVIPPEVLEKAHTYVELNFGKTYLTEMEEKQINHKMCTGHSWRLQSLFHRGDLKSCKEKLSV